VRRWIAPVIAAIVWSLATSTSSPVRAQEPGDTKCQAQDPAAKLSSGVIPDMIGCALKPTLVVLRRYDHIPVTAEIAGPPPGGSIVSQTPPAETRRRSDTQITLNFSDGSAAETAPPPPPPPPVPSPAPNVRVSVTTEPSPPYKTGDVVKFWVVVGNTGVEPIPFARVSMQLTNLTTVSVNPTFPTSCQQIPCDLRSVPPGANVSVFYRARIGVENSFRNVITVMPRPPDSDTSDNSVTVEGPVESPSTTGGDSNNGDDTVSQAPADVSVEIASEQTDTHLPGDPIAFRIRIHNAGPRAATNVLVDLTDENVSLQEVTGDCSNLPCTLGNIAPAGEASLRVLARLGTAGLFRSLVRATSQDDPDESNNTKAYAGTIRSVPPRGIADLSVTLTWMPTKSPRQGESAPIAFSVHNAGPDLATNVDLTTSLENATVLGLSQACETSPCTIAAASSIAVELHTRLDSVGPFMGRLKASSAQQDPDPSNNSAAFAGEVLPKREIPWIWIAVAVLGVIGAGIAAHAIRKSHWSRMIEVRSRLDRREDVKVGPIDIVIPIEVRTRVEPGEMHSSLIPISDA
jgi:uncharacterized repeat protein (TIGR01451 family)